MGAAGRVKVLVVSVVDVPVIMQLGFQQSASYENLDLPQFQLIVRVLDIPVVSQRQVQSFTLVQFLEVVDMPVGVQRQVPWGSECRKLCGGPAVAALLIRWSMSLLCWFRSCSSSTRSSPSLPITSSYGGYGGGRGFFARLRAFFALRPSGL